MTNQKERFQEALLQPDLVFEDEPEPPKRPDPWRTKGNVFKKYPDASREYKAWQRACKEALAVLSYGVHPLSWQPQRLYCAMCGMNNTPASYILVQHLLPLCHDHVAALKRFKPNEATQKWVKHRDSTLWKYNEEIGLWYMRQFTHKKTRPF